MPTGGVMIFSDFKKDFPEFSIVSLDDKYVKIAGKMCYVKEYNMVDKYGSVINVYVNSKSSEVHAYEVNGSSYSFSDLSLCTYSPVSLAGVLNISMLKKVYLEV